MHCLYVQEQWIKFRLVMDRSHGENVDLLQIKKKKKNLIFQPKLQLFTLILTILVQGLYTSFLWSVLNREYKSSKNWNHIQEIPKCRHGTSKMIHGQSRFYTSMLRHAIWKRSIVHQCHSQNCSDFVHHFIRHKTHLNLLFAVGTQKMILFGGVLWELWPPC